MKIDITMGEAVDRLSILKLKEAFTDVDVKSQIDELSGLVGDAMIKPCSKKLSAINFALWQLEDMVRTECNNWNIIASSIFALNEIRSQLKQEIDVDFHGGSIEGKKYDLRQD